MKKKPLVILSQDKFFSQWLKDKEGVEERLDEEKMFLIKKLNDAVEKYLEPVWNDARKELIDRGLLTEEELPKSELGGKESCEGRPRIAIYDGVLYLEDGCSHKGPLEVLSGLFGK